MAKVLSQGAVVVLFQKRRRGCCCDKLFSEADSEESKSSESTREKNNEDGSGRARSRQRLVNDTVYPGELDAINVRAGVIVGFAGFASQSTLALASAFVEFFALIVQLDTIIVSVVT